MEYKFKTFGTETTVVGSFNLLAMIFVLAGVCIAQTTNGQGQLPEPCAEPDFTFQGEAALTLCDQHGEILCDIEMGVGTPITHSSQIGSTFTGNVCIKGDFQIDQSFKFLNCIVKIDPGVTIFIQTPQQPFVSHLLTIDNSKLFACDDLWNGIVMSNSTAVNTKNGTQIEDAEIAIRAQNTQYNSLLISNTTFNRNRVGIELQTQVPKHGVSVSEPMLWTFTGNEFTCTAPLNGTTNEITEIGVRLRDASLYPFFGNTNNTFRGIIRGIVAESSGINAFASCDVYADNYLFEGIRSKGIDFQGRSLNVRNSTFESILGHGIHHHESPFLSLQNNQFFIREYPTTNWRFMVEVESPKIGNDLAISNNYFYTEGQLTSFHTWGVKFTNNSWGVGDPSISFNSRIFDNDFDLFNASFELPGELSHGIGIYGNLASDSDIDIENNRFNDNIFILSNNRSIDAWYGSKHGIHVIGNHFTGGGTHIEFWGSTNGGENIISDNTMDPSSDFGIGMFIHDFPQTTICANTNNGASNVGYLLRGQNLGTVFSGNHTYGCWQHAFWITGDQQPVIGQQIHNGNEWGPAVVPNDGFNYFVRPFLQHSDPDPDIVGMSKFFIHTPQSVWNGSQYTFFSPFHPANQEIVPDFNDEFFEQQSGTPTVNCLSQLQAPDEVDLMIADGSFAATIVNQGSVFDAKRFLYKKLMENPAYQSAHASFAAFLSAEQNTSVGKFYQLEKAIDDAHRLSAGDKATLDNLKAQRESIDQSMAQQGVTQSQLLGYIAQRERLDSAAYVIVSQHEAGITTALNNAMSIWQSISPQNLFEQYRKDVLGIYLSAQTQQGGLLTEVQVEDLQDIAKLCSEVGGSAVYLAQGFLPECDRAEIMDLIEQCHEVPEAEPRDNVDARHILISENAQVQVSPNPARDWINIVSVRQMEGRAEVYALTGQMVAAKNIAFGDNPIRFDLNSGVYVLRVIYDNGDVSSHKLVINK